MFTNLNILVMVSTWNCLLFVYYDTNSHTRIDEIRGTPSRDNELLPYLKRIVTEGPQNLSSSLGREYLNVSCLELFRNHETPLCSKKQLSKSVSFKRTKIVLFNLQNDTTYFRYLQDMFQQTAVNFSCATVYNRESNLYSMYGKAMVNRKRNKV